MKRNHYLTCIILLTTLMTGCSVISFEVDTQKLQEKIYEPTATPYNGLRQSVVLYLDHSTCVINAVQNSDVFKALRPNLGQYCDTLQLIKDSVFKSTSRDRQNNKVSDVLETIKQDIPFADIRKAVFQICNDNQQAILISDSESYANGRFLDLEPYMSEPFRDWLKKGHAIYIVTEPYKEAHKGRVYDKKLFYFFFTNDYMEAPISHNMLGEIQSLLQGGACSLYKMTNSDIFAQTPKSDVINENLDFNIEYHDGFEFISIENSWNAIREYVMKLDKHGEPQPEEKPIPLIKNISFNDGENYSIEDIRIQATNITSRYLSLDCDAAENLKLDCNGITPKDIDISEGFMLDRNAFQNNRLDVMLTDKIFTEGYLNNEYGGNLIRLDFVIANVGLKPFDNTVFEWKSIWNPNQTAICVSKSIDNALRDINVIPRGLIIHTIFVKTEKYK